MKCKYCSEVSVKNGFINSVQRYRCTECRRVFQKEYKYKAYEVVVNSNVVSFLKEGCGIRSIARLCGISTTTVMCRILKISKHINRPVMAVGKEYELDEMCTFIGNKSNRVWIAYTLRKDTKEVMDFRVGKRSKRMLRPLTESLVLAMSKRVSTDRLIHYQGLIPKAIHDTKKFGTNHIERMNLTLRTHLKRLNRRSICFSKSLTMLKACLKIYFWDNIVQSK
ncbi:MAG: IS1 family transposase [Flavobacteriales bacterium]|nr:IS1 family transposase [Flavobacteriales bacterium]